MSAIKTQVRRGTPASTEPCKKMCLWAESPPDRDRLQLLRSKQTIAETEGLYAEFG